MTYSILVAEDEPNIVLSLKFIMKKAGFDVRVAEDGEAALQEIKTAKPDLVLLDIMLPKRDGFSVCEQIKANQDWQDIKVIFLSAKSRETDMDRAMGMGADDYVTKPFSTRDLVDRVIALLEGSVSTRTGG